MGRDDDYRQTRLFAQQQRQQIHALLASQTQIEKRSVEMLFAYPVQSLFGRSGLGHGMAHALEDGVQRPP